MSDERNEIGKRILAEQEAMTTEEKIQKYRSLREQEYILSKKQEISNDVSDIHVERSFYQYWYHNFAIKTREDELMEEYLKERAKRCFYEEEYRKTQEEEKEKDEPLTRHFYAQWVKYYPHLYPETTNWHTHLNDHITRVFFAIDVIYNRLADTFGINYALKIDWEQTLLFLDPQRAQAIKRSRNAKHQKFIARAQEWFRTCEWDELCSFAFDLSNLEDESFGPLSGNYSEGMTLTEEQAERIIGKIADGR